MPDAGDPRARNRQIYELQQHLTRLFAAAKSPRPPAFVRWSTNMDTAIKAERGLREAVSELASSIESIIAALDDPVSSQDAPRDPDDASMIDDGLAMAQSPTDWCAEDNCITIHKLDKPHTWGNWPPHVAVEPEVAISDLWCESDDCILEHKISTPCQIATQFPRED